MRLEVFFEDEFEKANRKIGWEGDDSLPTILRISTLHGLENHMIWVMTWKHSRLYFLVGERKYYYCWLVFYGTKYRKDSIVEYWRINWIHASGLFRQPCLLVLRTVLLLVGQLICEVPHTTLEEHHFFFSFLKFSFCTKFLPSSTLICCHDDDDGGEF